MPLWLGQLLRDPGLGLALVAGHDAVDRRGPIRWAHISDTPDPTPWLEGGEVLLTTGLGVKHDPVLQRRLVANLTARGVVAVGFGIGVAVDDVPKALVEAAEEHALPLFTVPYEVPFIAVTRRVAQATFEEHYATLRGAVDVHRQVLSAVVGGAGVPGVLDVVAKHLPDVAMVAFDFFGNVLEHRDAAAILSDLAFDELFEFVSVRTSEQRGSRLRDREVIASAVRLGDEVEAYLAIISDEPLLEHELLLTEQAVTGLTLELARGLSIRQARRARATELLEDVQSGHASAALVRRHLGRAGFDLEHPVKAVCVRVEERSVRRVFGLVEELLGVPIPLVGRVDDHVVALIQPAESDPGQQLLDGAKARGIEHAQVGTSQPHGVDELRAALREATVAATRAAPGTSLDVAELGVSGLLAGLGDDESVGSFVTGALGPVLDHERDEGTPLVETLRAYLAHGCRPGPAADELGIHRHTLTYRLDRIRELTGHDPRDGAHLLTYTLALELLERRPDLR